MIPKTEYFEQSIQNIEIIIKKILHCCNWFSSDRINNEFVHLLNSLHQLWLDNNILQTSTEWSSQQDSQYMSSARQVLMQLLTGTRIFLDDYMDKFDILRYKELQPNQKNSIEEWALVSLDNIRKKLEPHTAASNDRIHLFSDSTGVTDRYTGYRNNLTKQSKPPFIYEPDWLRGRQQPLKKTDAILFDHQSKGLRKHILPVPATEHYYESLGDVPQSYSGDLLATAPGAVKQVNPIERINNVEKPTGVLGTKLRTGAALLPELITRGYLTIDSLYPRETVELHDPLPIFCNDTSESTYSKILKKTDEPLQAYKTATKSLSKEEALELAQLAAGLEPVLSYKSEYKDNFIKPLFNRF